MYKQLLLLTTLFWSFHAFSQTNPRQGDRGFEIQINTNAELLGFVYFLGYEGAQSETEGYSSRTKARYAYGLDVYQQYKSFANSKHLAVAIGFAQNIWLDYFLNLLVQLDDFPNAKLKDDIAPTYYLRFSPKRDSSEARKNASAFIAAMNGLYKEVDFGSYLHQNAGKYENAKSQVTAGLPDNRFVPAMESFYQGHLDSYILVPSLMIPPGMGFGVKYNSGEKTRAFHIFGSFAPPKYAAGSPPDMGFDNKKHLLELSTHEFGHSFVNSAIDQLPGELITATQSLYEPISQAMSDQAYTTWKSCLYEHFVRAGEILIAQNLGNSADADALKEHYINARKFVYLPELLKDLEAYNASRKGSYMQAVKSAMKRLEQKAATR
ncbi:DUF4932 domain-containing protein [Dyadobacter fanqingshengii]|uniref:DUF4932 domain-containing protein n=1 Tax=Dyadobacter fanqingshengii TaxID=2906443 RepID=A0A9X1PAB7_9BACT|nr:DUF4932 domain-containing protein [Dyadobacter fanqingshengii]MCF0041276.1 DUF4932 domain-containing protein [Dyadobacter fanqingshengii]USJ36999.1 DUF4932 domain-containing protein [Dyadobacter fanqingshengii]